MQSFCDKFQNSLSKILEKVHLRYFRNSWWILQEFVVCIPKSSSGRTATVLVGGRILRDVTLVAEDVHQDGKLQKARVTLQPGLLG